jgi:DNA primase
MVRQAIDIVDLVGEYLPLRREGRMYKALCPWHDDSKPSLTVNQERQIFRCWVCNIGGDVFSFLMKHENVTFPEALQMLADRAGIKLAARPGESADAAEQKRLLYQAMAWVEQQYHDFLLRSPEAEPARRYLAERSITPESINQWHLGAAPDRWEWIVEQARGTRYTPQMLSEIGVVGERRSGNGYYDRFKSRVLFSIRDAQARPVALGGRILPGSTDNNAAKYINSPETPLFSKSSLVYGLDQAKDAMSKTRVAMVMEGYTDVLTAHQFGFRNSVAVLGTALGERHIKLLRRFVDQIVLVLDGDEAGRKRADEVLELFVAADMDMRLLTLPDELDPAEFLLERGAEAFEAAIGTAVDALEHKFRCVTESLDGESSIHAVQRAVEQVLGTLAKAPGGDEMSSAARLKEEQILNRLGRKAGLSEESLRRRLLDLRRNQVTRTFHQPVRAAIIDPNAALHDAAEEDVEHPLPLAPPPRVIMPRREKAERWLIEIMLAWPDLVPGIVDRIDNTQIYCPRRRELFAMFRHLTETGVAPTFERLMLEFDDPAMKTLLVELDEEHRAINRLNAERELRDLLDWFQEEMSGSTPTQIGSPANRPSGTDLASLQRLVERKRSGRGAPSATDG